MFYAIFNIVENQDSSLDRLANIYQVANNQKILHETIRFQITQNSNSADFYKTVEKRVNELNSGV